MVRRTPHPRWDLAGPNPLQGLARPNHPQKHAGTTKLLHEPLGPNMRNRKPNLLPPKPPKGKQPLRSRRQRIPARRNGHPDRKRAQQQDLPRGALSGLRLRAGLHGGG